MTQGGLAQYEVDMTEALGQTPRTDYMVDWVWSWHRYCAYTGPDFTVGYHIYTFIWTAEAITWLIDGVQRCGFHYGMPTTRMYLTLNTRIGGSWLVPPDANTVLPQYTDIAYVRFYAPATTRPPRVPDSQDRS
jgi:beta-glucanase (GH16 family)